MESGFEMANSNNLPNVDVAMINDFFIKSSEFLNAEVQNVKMKRAARENYGDNSVGQVQVRREKDISLCTVKAKITPEHRVTGKGYAVTVTVNEKDEEVVTCVCHDCTASSGGCKHAVAFLMWLHRRSEEPSVTSVTCYWRTSKLSKVGKSLKGCTISEMYPIRLHQPMQSAEGRFRKKFIELGQQCNSQSYLVKMLEEDEVQRVSLHCLSVKYIKLINDPKPQADVDAFINFCKDQISEDDCLRIKILTEEQSKSTEWYNVRFGRITASKLHEAARSQTYDGSLVETIFGSTKISTGDMERGLRLENSVLDKVAMELNINIKKCGFIILKKYPIFGASPDGLSDKYCIEVKYPTKEKTVLNYVDKNNKICKKPYAQLQLQMYLSKKKHGLFCIASPNFEEDNTVNIIETQLDKEFCKNIMNEAIDFWKKAIFPKLVK